MTFEPEEKGNLNKLAISFTLYVEEEETHQLPISFYTEGFDNLSTLEREQVVQGFVDYLKAYPTLVNLSCFVVCDVSQQVTPTE